MSSLRFLDLSLALDSKEDMPADPEGSVGKRLKAIQIRVHSMHFSSLFSFSQVAGLCLPFVGEIALNQGVTFATKANDNRKGKHHNF